MITSTAKFLVWLTLLLLIVACTAKRDKTSPTPNDSANSSQLTLGRQVYLQNCAACHGANGEGQRPDAPLRKDETGRFPAPPHNSTGHTWHHDDDLLIQIIREGGMGDEDFYEMPAFGNVLTDEEIKAVLAFIKTLWTEEQRALQQERTEAVRSEP